MLSKEDWTELEANDKEKLNKFSWDFGAKVTKRMRL